MKCISNANDSTYIIYGFLIGMRYIWDPDFDYVNPFQKSIIWGQKKQYLKLSQSKIDCVGCPTATKKCLVEYRLLTEVLH